MLQPSKCLSEVLPVTFPYFLWGRIGFQETPSTCWAQDLAGARRVLRTFENCQPFQRWSRGSLAEKLPWACGVLPETCPALSLGWVVSSFSSPKARLGPMGEGPCAQRSLGKAQIPGGVWTRRGMQVSPRPSM